MPPFDKRIKKLIKDSTRIAPKISDKGELGELRTGLVSQYPQTRKDAIKKTIQQMTLGKDVSSLFPDILKNIATNDVEQKKLVYLYVMNYAETHPELCILAVNTFVTDAQDPNPLIRCMAIRTMSMIRVDKILEYIEIPLRRTLQDDNPYVRKTAVICVAKLFHLNKDLCIQLGVLGDLVSALDDDNPMVVANTIAALTEINTLDDTVVPLTGLINSHFTNFLNILNECTEWARITILTALAEYTAKDAIEAQSIIDRVTAHLQHVNPAVVLGAIKVIIKNLAFLDPNKSSIVMKKLSSALVSLMSTPPEMQYVALRNIRIILEKYPELLTKELRIFYVKFNDPLYVKLEKIEILVRLVDATNLKQCSLLLTEFKEYTMEFEPEFVSRSIQALSQLGIKYSQPNFISRVLDILMQIVTEREGEFADDCCVAICNLLRHCEYDEQMVGSVCALFNTWSDPTTSLQTEEAKCNYLWLLGQYSEKFSSIEEKLSGFTENFVHEEPLAQSATLLTVVKLHSKLPGSTLQHTLEMATNQTHDLDVRDMAMMYWRCLSMPNSEELVRQICEASPLKIESTLDKFSPEKLEKLLMQLANISSVYFKTHSDNRHKYVRHQKVIKGRHLDELKEIAEHEIVKNLRDEVLLDFDGEDDIGSSPGSPEGNNETSGVLHDLDDLFNNTSTKNDKNVGSAAVAEGISTLKLESSTSTTKTTGSSHSEDLLSLF